MKKPIETFDSATQPDQHNTTHPILLCFSFGWKHSERQLSQRNITKKEKHHKFTVKSHETMNENLAEFLKE